MRFKHDPLRPHPRRKKKNETPDETERRLSADLRLLMTDERYQKNDPDYRHFVQRQYRRVYDDPSGEPREGLKIGRPEVFVTDLEPFDRDRERRIRRGEEAESGRDRQETIATGAPAARQRRRSTARKSELGSANAGDETAKASQKQSVAQGPAASPIAKRSKGKIGGNDLPPPPEREPGPITLSDVTAQRRQDSLAKYNQRKEVAEARELSASFLEKARYLGWDNAVRAHEHYIEGSGTPLVLDAAIVEDYAPVLDAEQAMIGILTDWFRGEETDSTFGHPWIGLADGEHIEVGDPSVGPDHMDGLVHWEKTFEGPSKLLQPFEYLSDARMTFNSGTLESFSDFAFKREGNRIYITGTVRLRVIDRYDFGEEHPLRSKVLEDHGGAKSFDLSTTIWTRPVFGWIESNDTSTPSVFLIYDD